MPFAETHILLCTTDSTVRDRFRNALPAQAAVSGTSFRCTSKMELPDNPTSLGRSYNAVFLDATLFASESPTELIDAAARIAQQAHPLPVALLSTECEPQQLEHGLSAGLFDIIDPADIGPGSLLRSLVRMCSKPASHQASSPAAEQLLHIFSEIPSPVVITNAELNVSWCNAAFRAISTMQPDGAHIFSCFSFGDKQNSIRMTIAAGDSCEEEFCLKQTSIEKWMTVQFQPLLNAHGGITHFLVLFHDTTDRHTMRAQLEESVRKQTKLSQEAQKGLTGKNGFPDHY